MGRPGGMWALAPPGCPAEKVLEAVSAVLIRGFGEIAGGTRRVRGRGIEQGELGAAFQDCTTSMGPMPSNARSSIHVSPRDRILALTPGHGLLIAVQKVADANSETTRATR